MIFKIKLLSWAATYHVQAPVIFVIPCMCTQKILNFLKASYMKSFVWQLKHTILGISLFHNIGIFLRHWNIWSHYLVTWPVNLKSWYGLGTCWYAKCGMLAIKTTNFTIILPNMYHLSKSNPKSNSWNLIRPRTLKPYEACQSSPPSIILMQNVHDICIPNLWY